MAAPFEERSGVVPCRTPWGRWYQTLEEVFVEVHVPPGTRAKDVSCSLQSRHLALAVGGRQLLQGKLFDSTIADEGTWTLEDRKLIRIVLMKTNRDAGNCWTSLLENDYAADPWVQDQMQRKLTLERFQREASQRSLITAYILFARVGYGRESWVKRLLSCAMETYTVGQ
uniref:NudC domain-containing protein 2 n=1 Tax=Anas platyrhynchos platyrhynchos TaxID=8840 RepID=A0A493TR80_ANAPP